MKIMQVYYFLNFFWVWFNLIVMIPFFIALVNRIKNPSIKKQLWTDLLSRFCLFLTIIFYVFDVFVKSYVDGTQFICQKAVIIHHVGSFFILGPIVLNKYVPWQVDAVGFIHGYIVFFDNQVFLQYLYASMMFYLHYKLHKKDYQQLKFYEITKFSLNFVWVFLIIYRAGDCSNFLQLQADQF